MKQIAPIALFVYNRPEKIERTINSLQKNFLAEKSELFVFSDGPKYPKDRKNVKQVREYLQEVDGFKTVQIKESTDNKGLSTSIINGITEMFTKYGKVIVLEDDLITSPNFLDFMNQALNYYDNKSKVMSINGYSLDVGKKENCSDVYFHPRTYSWGWATWKEYWDRKKFQTDYIIDNFSNVDVEEYKNMMGNDAFKMLERSINNLNDSWYARWIFQHFEENKLSVYPFISKVKNIGFSEEGTHCKTINAHQIKFDQSNKRKFSFTANINVQKQINKRFKRYFSKWYKVTYRFQMLKSLESIKLLYRDLWQKLK
ncbi:glycosyltransferase [Aliifodinibius sp. S!AR15-10]|uniref:glycosyltransferase n=1 Tax=Aliifodinibius sp. S!AR15-10 TaxID=2950437 RepID=UPI00285B41FC|nr:glycosyltransferase [Aliifodinibius sp. S!AR15-10]MDR8393374.1 glycosyltransferase [Aliifodinibius sp. S!AR15-10]